MKVLVHEDLRVVVGALGALLAETVHVVPAELANDMFELAGLAVEAETHVEVWTAFIDVAKGAVLALLTLFSHEVGANLEVMTEVALVSVPASAHTFEFVAGFDFTLVMRVGAVVR